MSLRISKLKKAKVLVGEYFLKTFGMTYRFGIFYAEGTKENKHEDQFLKLEVELPENAWEQFKASVLTYLIGVDTEYRGLKIIVTQYHQKQKDKIAKRKSFRYE